MKNLTLKTQQHVDLVNKISTDALLHLYLHVASTTRFVPLAKRNEILNKYLKAKLKLARNKLIKNDLKPVVALAKNGDSIEKALNKLLAITSVTDENLLELPHTDRLFKFLSKLHDDAKIQSLIYKEGEELEVSALYVKEVDVDSCFSDDAKQINPLPFVVNGSESLAKEVFNFIEASPLYNYSKPIREGNITKSSLILI